VVQQKQGRVKPTKQMTGKVNVNDSAGLEKEADVMGEKALFLSPSTFPFQAKQIGQSNTEVVQRVFRPVFTRYNAHLRNNNVWKTTIGNKIDKGSEIVVDPAQKQTESKTWSDTVWTKAVNVTGAVWDRNTGNGAQTYIRDTRIGADKEYPQPAGKTHKLPKEKRPDTDKPVLNWHVQSGEFEEIEDSVSTNNAKIAYHKGTYKQIIPATGHSQDLDEDEQRQVDISKFEKYLRDRMKATLTAGTDGALWQKLLVTDANISKIMNTTNDSSKALRFEKFGRNQYGAKFVSYYKWVTDENGPFARILAGAQYVHKALEHWKNVLNHPKEVGLTITSIEMSGSDLHEAGLGVMFVTFNFKKPDGGNADYEVVVKPEERDLEEKLFGTQNDSLAKEINTSVGLAGPNEIATYKQQVEVGFGTLC